MATPLINGYSAPLRFKKNLKPGAVHPLDGAPIEVVGQMGDLIDNGQVHSFDHFVNYAGPLAEGSAGGYTLVGTTGTATLAHTGEDHGKITVLTGTTEDNNFVFRNDAHTVNYATDKLILWAVKLSITDANDMEFYAGLAVVAADWVATLPTDGFFFEKAETATNFDFHVRASGTSTENAADFSGLTVGDGEDVVLVIRIENGHITPYVWHSDTWYTGTTVLSSDANVPATTADLEAQVAAETGNAGAEGAEIDWIYVSKEV